MILKLRVYRRHDIDLMALLANTSFDFASAVKECLKEYVRGTSAVIKLPNEKNFSKAVNYSVVQIHIKLSESFDSDIIEFVNSLPKGTRNCFIKALLRNSLEAPYIDAFYADLTFKGKRIKDVGETSSEDVEKIVKEIINSPTRVPSSKTVYIEAADKVLKRKE